jgi:hypothetical protein
VKTMRGIAISAAVATPWKPISRATSGGSRPVANTAMSAAQVTTTFADPGQVSRVHGPEHSRCHRFLGATYPGLPVQRLAHSASTSAAAPGSGGIVTASRVLVRMNHGSSMHRGTR